MIIILFNNLFKRLFVCFLICVMGLSLTVPDTALAAGTASFSFSATSGSYHVGDTINISISETSALSDNVNAVQTDLSYNTSFLQYQSTTLTGPFTICATNSGGGGSVSLACASPSTVSGTQAVATISFKVLATGSTAVSMASTSDIDNNLGSSVWDGILPSASFTLTAASSSSGGGGGSSSSNSSCTAQAPTSAPNLFQIDVTNTTATLYFSPPGDPYNSFYISFGNGTNSEGYSAQFSTGHSTGVIYYTVRELSPSTVYTFKVRGGNGCKPGPWSNTLTVLTLPRGSRYTKKYYENQQAPVIQSTITSWVQQAGYYVSDHYSGVQFPNAPLTGLGAPVTKAHMKFIPQKAATHLASVIQRPQSSLWGNIVSAIKGMFHF